MLTVKYLQADGVETIGEYDSVTAERDERGLRIVYAHRNDGGENCVQFGPIPARSTQEVALPAVYVMNRFGATVANYGL